MPVQCGVLARLRLISLSAGPFCAADFFAPQEQFYPTDVGSGALAVRKLLPRAARNKFTRYDSLPGALSVIPLLSLASLDRIPTNACVFLVIGTIAPRPVFLAKTSEALGGALSAERKTE